MKKIFIIFWSIALVGIILLISNFIWFSVLTIIIGNCLCVMGIVMPIIIATEEGVEKRERDGGI